MSQDAFAETGLAKSLAGAAAARGWDAPTPLQASAIPVIRRGNNVVLRAASGAGVTFAWAAGLLERLSGPAAEPGTRVLVLVISAERAATLAETLARTASLATGEEGAQWRGLRIRALAPGWSSDDADLLVAPVASAARSVGQARLKLEGLAGLVVEDPGTMISAGQREDLELVLTAVPGDAQRVMVLAPRDDDAAIELAEAHARRALTIPPRPHDGASPPEPKRRVGVILTPESAKLDALCAALTGRDAAGDVVLARSRARAARLTQALDRRGLGPTAGGPAVAAFADGDRGTIAWDVPFDAAGFDALSGDAPLVLAVPAERAHLHALARAAGVALDSVRGTGQPRDGIAAWRGRIEQAMADEDIDAQLTLLAPLFERHAAEEIAAALSALLRKKTPAPADAAPAREARGAPPPQPSFVRLFFSVGQRDGLRPADLVGAITGETGLPGEKVGRIEIRDTFSVAEVESDGAEKVIRALNGTTVRGRSVRVDYDRRSTPGAVRRSRPPRPGP